MSPNLPEILNGNLPARHEISNPSLSDVSQILIETKYVWQITKYSTKICLPDNEIWAQISMPNLVILNPNLPAGSRNIESKSVCQIKHSTQKCMTDHEILNQNLSTGFIEPKSACRITKYWAQICLSDHEILIQNLSAGSRNIEPKSVCWITKYRTKSACRITKYRTQICLPNHEISNPNLPARSRNVGQPSQYHDTLSPLKSR